MFDVLHQLIDKVHGWRSEEDRVNAHTAVDDYQAEQEGTKVDPSEESSDTSTSTVTEDSTASERLKSSDPRESLFTDSSQRKESSAASRDRSQE